MVHFIGAEVGVALNLSLKEKLEEEFRSLIGVEH